MLLRFGERVTLESVEPGFAGDPDTGPLGQPLIGRIGLPQAGAWTRLLTGRLEPAHLPSGVTSAGRPTPAELAAAFREGPW